MDKDVRRHFGVGRGEVVERLAPGGAEDVIDDIGIAAADDLLRLGPEGGVEFNLDARLLRP